MDYLPLWEVLNKNSPRKRRKNLHRFRGLLDTLADIIYKLFDRLFNWVAVKENIKINFRYNGQYFGLSLWAMLP
jgi:hypothetical protein